MSIIVSGDWWRLENDGTLYVECVGDMPDYAPTDTIPWYDYRQQISLAAIGASVTSVGAQAFIDCTSLQSAIIAGNATSVNAFAFANCENLTSVFIPASVANIGNYAFDGCYRLTDVYYGGTESQWNAITVGSDNDPLSNVTIHYNSSPEPFPNVALVSIAITTPPTKTAYTAGETFDPEGMVVTATYSDGSAMPITQYAISPSTLTASDTTITVSHTRNGVSRTATVAITVTEPEPTPEPAPIPEDWGNMVWPRLAPYVMREIADRCGVEIDPRSAGEIPNSNIEDTALSMSMRQVAGYVAAMMGGVWTITDDNKLYCVPLGDISRLPSASVGEDNAESLSVSDPLEPWSGVRAVWDGDEYDASTQGDESVIVKRGDELILKGSENGRVLEVKLAFGQVNNPAQAWDSWATRLLGKINGDAYYPFEAVNAVLDPAVEIGDAVELPDGQSVIFSMSGELDGLCAVDISAPPDEALNTAYPASWQAPSSGARVTSAEVERIVEAAWNGDS